MAPTQWLADGNNTADLTKFFRALLRSYTWIKDPTNRDAGMREREREENERGMIGINYSRSELFHLH